jgi:hypothetical protein
MHSPSVKTPHIQDIFGSIFFYIHFYQAYNLVKKKKKQLQRNPINIHNNIIIYSAIINFCIIILLLLEGEKLMIAFLKI